MGCTCYGILSLVSSGAAVLLLSLALGLPLWSANDRTFTPPEGQDLNTVVETADRGYGVWGVCTEITVSQEESDVGNCYPYFTNKKVSSFAKRNADNLDNTALENVDLDSSLCKYFREIEDFSFLPVDILSQNDIDFLDRMCSSKGKATLSFAVLSAGFVFIAFVLLVLSITCCKKNGCVVKLGSFFLTMAVIWAVLSVALWAYVSSPLRAGEDSGNTFAASFFLAIAGIVATLVASFFVGCHIKKGDVDELRGV